MKSTDNFLYKRNCMYNRHINTFVVSKDEWDTKENTGKSMKNALYILSGRSNVEHRKKSSL